MASSFAAAEQIDRTEQPWFTPVPFLQRRQRRFLYPMVLFNCRWWGGRKHDKPQDKDAGAAAREPGVGNGGGKSERSQFMPESLKVIPKMPQTAAEQNKCCYHRKCSSYLRQQTAAIDTANRLLTATGNGVANAHAGTVSLMLPEQRLLARCRTTKSRTEKKNEYITLAYGWKETCFRMRPPFIKRKLKLSPLVSSHDRPGDRSSSS